MPLARILSQTNPICQYQLRPISGRIRPHRRLLVLTSGGARDDPERLCRLPADAELGDDPVAVAPVDRDRELADVARRAARHALEEERRRMERHASVADSSSSVTVGSTVCSPPTISIP